MLLPRPIRSLATAFALTVVTSAVGQFLQVGSGPYDYNDPSNWTNSIVNGVFSQTLVAHQTVGFYANSTINTNLTFNFGGAYDETLSGLGGDRSITLGGDISVRSALGGRTVTVGSLASPGNLNVNFGSTTRTIDVAENDTLIFVNSIQRIWPLDKTGTGTLVLSGTSTFTGAINTSTTVFNGTLVLDHRTQNSPKLNPSSGLAVGNLVVLGSATSPTTESVSYLIPQTDTGASTITVISGDSQSASLSTGTLTQNGNLGTTMNFVLPSNGAIYTSTSNTNGILGGFLTVGQGTWGTRNSSGKLVPFDAYVNAISEAANVDIISDQTVASNVTASSLRFNATASTHINIAGSAKLTVGGILVTDNVGANTSYISNGILSSSPELIIHQYDHSGSLQIDSVIDASFGLTVTGTGIVALRGINTYGWGTTINGAVLNITADSNLGVHFDDIDINGGTLQLGASVTLDTYRSIKLGDSGGTIDTNGFDLTFSSFGSISGNGGLKKIGRGTFFMGNNSVYAGETAIREGALVISWNGLGSTAKGTTVYDGATLGIQGDYAFLSLEPLVLNGQGGGNGAFRNLSGTNTFAGPMTLNTDSQINADAGQLTLTGTISGAHTLTKEGPGLLKLSGVNTYGKGSVLNAGTLTITQDRSLGAVPAGPTTNLTINTGTLQCDNSNSITLDQNRSILLNGTRAVVNGLDSNGRTFTILGQITGPGTLSKIGAGTVRLSNPNNTYGGGTIISAGALQFDSLGAVAGSGHNVKINAAGIAAAGYPIDQNFLSRIDPSSTGVIALAVNSDTLLDLGVSSLTNARFGATTSVVYGGALIPAGSVYHIGGAGGTLTFTRADALSGNASLEIGPSLSAAGTVVLSNNNTLTGAVSVSGCLLRIDASTLSSGPIEVMSGATLDLSSGTINSTTVTIDPGGLLSGCGTINADVVNNGTVSVNCSGALNLTGNVTNNGTMGAYSGSTIVATGSFVNNGILDLLTSPQTVLPPGFVNNGTVIDSSNVAIQSVSSTATTFTVTIRSFTGHSYQLQRTAFLDPASVSWQNVGNARIGNTGEVFIFTDNNATGSQMFYRVLVSP